MIKHQKFLWILAATALSVSLFAGCDTAGITTGEITTSGGTIPIVPDNSAMASAVLTDITLLSEEEVKQIAFNHAGIAEEDISFIKVKQDYDNGRLEYEVEFYAGNTEYDYDIDATTGDILACDYDAESYSAPTTANSDNLIGEAKAKEVALAHAGIAESDAVFIRTQLDYADGRVKYEVEFYQGNTEYDYDIDATTGDILSYDYDVESYAPPAAAQSSQAAQAQTAQTTQTTTPQTAAANTNNPIGEARAKEIALAHAGVSASSVNFVQTELDYDDGRTKYEIEFYSGNMEYDYDIDAFSGAILSFDHDAEHYAPPAQTTQTNANTGNLIGEARAKEIALAHAGVSASSVSYMKVKQDYDDGRAEYEVEFYVGRTEYSFEIDAVSGTILDYDIDYD